MNKSRSKSRGKSMANSGSKKKETKTSIPKSQQQGPKGKRNAYMYFSADVRDEVREKLISKHRGNEDSVTGPMITAEISKRYKDMSYKDFKHYEDLAKKDTERYESQVSDWHTKSYWIDEETGEKSYPKRKKIKGTRSASKRKNKTVDSESEGEDETEKNLSKNKKK
jgi:hypothetical protein